MKETTRLDVYHHLVAGSADPRIDQLLAQGRQLLTMANADTKAILKRIDDATNATAARIRAILEKVGTGMTQAEVDEVNALGVAEAEKLEGLSHDPDNPVPPV